MIEQKPADLKALLDKIKQLYSDAPDLAKQMMEQFVKQSDHVREMDTKALDAEIRVTNRGQVFGFVIALVAIIAGSLTSAVGAYFSGAGAQWSGGGIATVGFVGLATAYIFSRQKKPAPTA